MKRKIILLLLVLLVSIPLVLLYMRASSRAYKRKADIHINTRKITGPLYTNWKAFAQGGETKNTDLFENVLPQLKDLGPRHIRVDHMLDFHNVVSRGSNGKIAFYWTRLDEIVCDILETGAKPFFSLGYMPPTVSSDGSLISKPKDWNEWAEIVQQTVERYSGKNTVLCGKFTGENLSNIYYEVWNEPDLESFGKWSIYGGEKSYKDLYFHSSRGATRAQNVNVFYLGGPATTAAYKNWFRTLIAFARDNNLKLDFISYHHYSKDPEEYVKTLANVDKWLSDLGKYSRMSIIITEYGYNSNYDPIADTNVGAAYTIAAVRKLVDQKLDFAFNFELKDGPNPSWGILTNDGVEKPRYKAFKLLNVLEGFRLEVTGEGTHVSAIATYTPKKKSMVLVNYDLADDNTELVPVTFDNLDNGLYQLKMSYLEGNSTIIDNIEVTDNRLQKNFLMKPNSVLALELLPL